MACIYHIYSQTPGGGSSDEIYIGQTNGTPDPDSFSKRPMSHFSGVYSKAASQRENVMFFEFLEKYPLNTMVVEIYDENSMFGLSPEVFESFFAEGIIDGMKPSGSLTELVNGNLQITDNQKKFAMSFYLDAAEIIHNYIYQHKGYKLLTHQIGGQKTTFRSKNGLVLNSTLDVETACALLDTENSGSIELQNEFNKILDKYIYSVEIDGKTLPAALAISAINHMSKKPPTDYANDGTTIIARYFQKVIPIIRDDLDKILVGKTTINISNKLKYLYSDIESKFMGNFNRNNKGSFNIINAIIQKLTTTKLKDEYKNLQNFLDDLTKQLNTILQGTISGNISFGNFFIIEPDNSIIKPRSWAINDPNEIHHALDDDPYGGSFRKRAYGFFTRELEKVGRDDIQFTAKRFVDGFNTRYYLVSTYNLSAALRRQFIKDVRNPYIIDNGEAYVRPMLTIYTQLHRTTIGGIGQGTNVVDGIPLAIPDLGLVSLTSESGSIDKETQNQREDTGYLAYQFSDDALQAISYWMSKHIKDINVF